MSIIRAKTLDLKLTKPLTEVQSQNSILNEKEALENISNVKSYPRRLVLEMTNACNINCKMCGRNASEFKPTVFNMDWLKIFEPIVGKIEEITLLGWGEPTLHPEFSKFLEFSHKHGLRKFFCTNGTRLDKLKDDIFKYEVDLLTISLDGAKSSTNNAIRCGADFDTIVANVKAIADEKKKRGTTYPILSFVMTMMESNYRELPDYVRLAKECGVNEIKGVYLTIFDKKMSDENLLNNQENLKRVFDETEKLGEELDITVKLPFIQGEDIAGTKQHKDCFVGWRDFFLGSDGYVRSCMSTPIKLFKIDKYENFNDMWNSPEYIDFRCKVNSNNMCNSCKNCYQASTANWNKESSFNQIGMNFAPKWERDDKK